MPYIKKNGDVTVQVNASVSQVVFERCQEILSRKDKSVTDFVREQLEKVAAEEAC